MNDGIWGSKVKTSWTYDQSDILIPERSGNCIFEAGIKGLPDVVKGIAFGQLCDKS